MASEISSDDFRGVLDRLIARERPLNRAEVAHWQSTGDYLSKYRGDEDRDFVSSKFNTESFPTINVIKGGKATKYESEDRSVEALSALV